MRESAFGKYEAPSTHRTQVQLEHGFMKASVINKDDKDKVETSGHEMGSTYDAQEWKTEEWK